MGIGKRIGEECKRQGMNLRQLSINSGVPYSTLYSAVSRDSNGIDADTLRKVSDALGISTSTLYAPSSPYINFDFSNFDDYCAVDGYGDDDSYTPAVVSLIEKFIDALDPSAPSKSAKEIAVPHLTKKENNDLARMSDAEFSSILNLSKLLCYVSHISNKNHTEIKQNDAMRIIAREILSTHTPSISETNSAISSQIEQLLQDFNKLNPAGREKALERVHELTEVPRYTSPAVTPAPASTAESTQAAPQSPTGGNDTPKGD